MISERKEKKKKRRDFTHWNNYYFQNNISICHDNGIPTMLTFVIKIRIIIYTKL